MFCILLDISWMTSVNVLSSCSNRGRNCIPSSSRTSSTLKRGSRSEFPGTNRSVQFLMELLRSSLAWLDRSTDTQLWKLFNCSLRYNEMFSSRMTRSMMSGNHVDISLYSDLSSCDATSDLRSLIVMAPSFLLQENRQQSSEKMFVNLVLFTETSRPRKLRV